jgi:tripartite-type tricarboxylate transporter receptor subunit TctC
MNRSRLKYALLCASLLAAAAFAAVATAQPYPSKPIHLIVPFAAGGSSDVLARGVAKQLGEQMQASFIVENRPGAGGNLAAAFVAKAPADGYTVLFGTIGTFGISPALYKNLPFDPRNDFAPISLLHQLPNVLIVHSSLPVQSVQDLIGYARANPGKVAFASAGNGSISHLAGEMLKSMAGIDIVHVPYKGGGAAMPDLMSGQVSMMIETITNALAAARSGKLRAVAVTSAKRWPLAQELPTMIEGGVPGYQVDSWTGLLAPRGTPRPIIERLNTELVAAAKTPAYREAMLALGVEAISSTPDEFRSFMDAEIAKWAKVIQVSGAKID